MKYHAVYKCPICGKLSTVGDSVEIMYDDLPKILGKIVRNQAFAGNPYLHEVPMYVVCKCEDGNAGLAQFSGFMQDKSNSEKEVIDFVRKLINGIK